MSPRNVFLLGPLHIQDDANPPPPLRSQRTAALLAYLVAQARPVPRDALAALLWPDADLATGRANLRRELHNLNRILPGCWQIDRQAAHFVGSGETRIDLHEVRRLDEAGQWREAAAWLRGGFMAGLNLDGSLEFETWLSGER
ncbi:MAG: hypothetical protein KC425_13345, partial [Anaerolineales bacterium]|nr:hypothetical protein [Anaerolineales bacterium]